MTETERIEMFAALAELSRKHPQWRVGQLIANVAGWADAEIWDVEDEQLLAAAKAYLNDSTGVAGIDSTPNPRQQLTGAA